MPNETEKPGDPLACFKDGARIGGSGLPMPLIGTVIGVRILGGLAIVRTERVFRNDESASIEATITFPVPVHATLVGLTASIDGRSLAARAQRRQQARATYEAAVDTGRTAVLHEEALRGIHMLSVAHVPPGKQIGVTSVWAMPLSWQGGAPHLRIPVSVGDIYGRSPLADCDDLIHGPVVHAAKLTVAADIGIVEMRGVALPNGEADIVLDRPIDIRLSDWSPQLLHGVAADGDKVTMHIRPAPEADAPLDVDLVIDQSGSMSGAAAADGRRIIGTSHANPSKHHVMTQGLAQMLAGKRPGDRIGLWQFNETCQEITSIRHLWGPRGGTAIGAALDCVVAKSNAADIAVITDGKSHDIDVQALARTGRRFTVILIGDDSLDAHIGHLAALTGGQVFVVAGIDAADAIVASMIALRSPHAVRSAIDGALVSTSAAIGGMEVTAQWTRAGDDAGVSLPVSAEDGRIVGAVAAGLAMARMEEERAAAFAEAHGIACHLTSLVLVDEAGEVQDGIPAQRRVPLMTPAASLMHLAQKHPAPKYRAPKRVAAMPMALDAMHLPSALGESPVSGPPPYRKSLFHQGSLAGPDRAKAKPKRWISLSVLMGFFARMWTAVEPPMPRRPKADAPQLLSLKNIVGMIDWSQAEDLRRGTTRALPAEAVAAILRASAIDVVKELARSLGADPVVVVIGLLAMASRDTDRNAERLFRTVMGKGDLARIHEAMKALDLFLPALQMAQ